MPLRSGARSSAVSMSSDVGDSQAALVATLREAFGRVVYSHKTHEKAREIEAKRVVEVKWANIILTTLTSASLLGTVITNARASLYVSSALAAVTLAFVVFQLSFDPQGGAERHRVAANQLWYVREQYINLLTDLRDGMSSQEGRQRRDALGERLKDVYEHAPGTSSRAYRAAQRALKIKEEMTFSDAEIDQFLPKELHGAG